MNYAGFNKITGRSCSLPNTFESFSVLFIKVSLLSSLWTASTCCAESQTRLLSLLEI